MIDSANFDIYQNKNKLMISARNFPDGYSIAGYYLMVNGDILEKIFTDSLYHEFVIKVNGIYSILIYYRYLNEETKVLRLNSFEFKLDITEGNIISNLIDVSFNKNKIIIDCTKSYEYLYKIAKYEILLDGQEYSAKEFNEYKEILTVDKNGLYSINIYYLDYNKVEHKLLYNVNAIRIELTSATLDYKRINKEIKNYRLLFYIIYAFILREFQRKYDKGYFRYFSIILGPSVQLGIMVAIFTMMGTKNILGLKIPIFILTGILPYNFFTSAGNCLTIISGNRDLLNYKQVKIIDVIISSILMELLVVVTVFSGGVLICCYLGMSITIYNPLALISSFILLFILTFGLGLVLSVVGFYFAEFNYAIQIIFRALFYISGVFFSVENIPVQYQKYVLWNPLLQLIELIRFSFVSFKIPNELDYFYLLKCTVSVFLFGLSLYFINRNKFMVNDRAR